VPGPDQFAFRLTKDGRVRIAFHGRHVVTVAGASAARLRAQLDGAGDEAVQQLLARATGNFRRGNERRGGGDQRRGAGERAEPGG
jgi:hypothetical protein